MAVVLDFILPWTQEVAVGGDTVFNTTWTADVATDVVVYARAAATEPNDVTQLVSTSDYNVTFIGDGRIVRVTFLVARTAGDIITITRDTPADRLNLFINTNFQPSMLNGQFGRLVMMIQQNDLYNLDFAPHYNVSSTPTAPDRIADIILPILPPGYGWRKNAANTMIEAVLTVTTPVGAFAPFTDDNRLVRTRIVGSENTIEQRNVELTDGNVIQSTAGDLGFDAAGDLIFRGIKWPTGGAVAGRVLQLSAPDQLDFADLTLLFATPQLDNLSAVAINTSLISDTDITDDLGSAAIRWNNLYIQNIRTGQTGGNTVLLQAYNTNTMSYTTFGTLTAGNPPAFSLGTGTTGSTAAPGTNNTTLATTAYVDAAVTAASAVYATRALDNLTGVAINTTLVSDTDITDDLGTSLVRWNNIYSATLRTGETNTNTLLLQARDVDGSSWVTFVTLTAGNTPTGVLNGAITTTTQAPLDNSTKIATTAYVDAATGGGSGANVMLSNLSSVAINTSLVSDTDITDDLGTQAIRWRNVYTQTIQTGDTATDTLSLGAWDVDGMVFVPFFTMTANNTPTGVLASSVTGTTQSPNTNNTTLATTAYVDAAIATISEGLDVKDPVVAATTGALTATYDNGVSGVGATLTNSGVQLALILDTVVMMVGDRVLVKDQADSAENGIYVVTDVGSAITDWVIERATDYDEAPDEIFPGNFIIILEGALYANTGWIQTATVTTIGTDDVLFAQFGAANFANRELNNLITTAINTSLVSDTDITDDLGSQAIRWRNVYAQTLQTGDTATDTLTIGGWDVDGGSLTAFITITAANTPTCVLNGAITTTTQAPATNNTTIATTAYVDAAVSAVSGFANTALSNLAAVAINTTLVSDTDITDDLGTQAIRWRNVYAQTVQTGDTAADTLQIGAWDVDGASFTPFLTFTANNTPTGVIASAMTGTTQSPMTNNTTVATTAYVDAAVSAGPGGGGNATIGKIYPIIINQFSN